MITLPKGVVSTPGYPKMLKKNTTCVWVVSFPPQDGDNVNVVKYSFLINGTAYQPGSVEIRDGSSVRSDIVDVGTVVINKMSTNMTRSSGLWVKYSVRLVKGSAPAFRLNFTKYACPKTQQCDNGVCMQDNWKCNGNNDCGDNSDEMDCGGKPVPGSTGISVTVFVVTLLVVTALTIAATLLIQRYVLRARSPYNQFQDNAAEA
ncbi:PREDICTED: low-density lipoprotein receptor-related protein 3-like [Priapulus caudatus]|uniref:Low-density lipoprotein receptor-related protein 3-like n=1 Tax=Priapulus caudatus TaxID=37621 RepID=A0ABM1EV15_PRICU|nr:PREDICTED: low-density lipoprotein receptor-related protein 3-like [Priapulus caudatus]